MDQIIAFIRQFVDLFVWWIIVKPWEQAVRVRLGKHVTLLKAGVHLRIPIADSVYVQSTRKRMAVTGRQTILSQDGKNVTLCASIGFAIKDVLLLYNTLHHAEDTIRNMTIAQFARAVQAHPATTPLATLENWVMEHMDLKQFGLCDITVSLNEFTIVRTYRLIGDYAQAYQSGSSLTTELEHTAAQPR